MLQYCVNMSSDGDKDGNNINFSEDSVGVVMEEESFYNFAEFDQAEDACEEQRVALAIAERAAGTIGYKRAAEKYKISSVKKIRT